jgi:exodeoxyribonuclease VII large subunit
LAERVWGVGDVDARGVSAPRRGETTSTTRNYAGVHLDAGLIASAPSDRLFRRSLFDEEDEVDPNPNHAGDDDPGGEIIWLFDADATTDLNPCSPAELFARLERAAAREGLVSVAVRGSIRGLRRRGRICTFELTDHTAGTSERAVALIRVVVFPEQLRAAERAASAVGRSLADGVDATVVGAVRFDPPYGGVRIVAATIEVHEGESEHARRVTDLLAALQRDGSLTRNAALVVPGRPLRVGLVTSPGTAGDADVATLLEASGLEWQLLRQAVPMAGPSAPAAVAAAIGRLSRSSPDVILVARGGGGRTELDCWDTEEVARAIANAPVPVWTAIGHAPDATVADRVANRSCPTPSAAAADLVTRVRDFERHRHERAVFAEHRQRVAAERVRVNRARLVAALALVALVLVVFLAVR